MNQVEVKPVRTPREMNLLLTFPWKVFKDDPCWVPPLLPELRERVDPRRGVFFKRGEAEFFIAWRDGQPVGTICAANDRGMNEDQHTLECMFGFFHFIEDYAVMQALLETASRWGLERGLDTLIGPFNLDYEDGYGILVEGRGRPAALMCGHTPPYYLGFVERFGFEPLRGENIAYALDLTTPSAELQDLERMAARVRARKNYTIRPADLDHWEDELDRIHTLLNLALHHLTDFRPWPREVVYNSLAPFRKIADPELILFAEDEGRTVGCIPGIPDLNEAFIHANGLRYPWDYLSLWWHMQRHTECLSVKSILLLPEYWGSGLGILMIQEIIERARARGYRWMDGSLTSADNPRTPAVAERLGAKIYKRYRTYKKKITVSD